MKKDFATRFFKICMGTAMVIFAIAVMIFSLKDNAAKANTGSTGTKTSDNDYVPVGIYVNDSHVYLYGYNKSEILPSQQIKVIAKVDRR